VKQEMMRWIGVTALVTVLASCGYFRDQAIFDDVPVVAHYFDGHKDGSIVFEAGPYQGGTAFIDSAGAAFWVKDGGRAMLSTTLPARRRRSCRRRPTASPTTTRSLRLHLQRTNKKNSARTATMSSRLFFWSSEARFADSLG
jgi:hypothetical protein